MFVLISLHSLDQMVVMNKDVLRSLCTVSNITIAVY